MEAPTQQVEDAPVEPEIEEPGSGDDAQEPDPAPVTEIVRFEHPTPLVPGHDIPIIPAHQEMQGLAAMAVTLAGADAVPAALRGKPNDVFQILLTARDLGVAVTTGMREFHVIDGKVTLSPKVKLAMVNERGRAEGWAMWPDPGNDAEQATWYATRRDRPGLTFSSTFTMAEADNVTAKGKPLSGKDNWQNYPKRMLSWRALGYLLDDVFPEVGTGLYSPDEMGAMTDEDGQVIDVSSTEPLPGTKAPRGHGPKEADPLDQPLCDADPAVCSDLETRVAAIIAAGVEARTALLDLWSDKASGWVNPLPVFGDLLLRHRPKAEAVVASIEARLAKGAFGPQDAEGPAEEETPVEPAGTPETANQGPPGAREAKEAAALAQYDADLLRPSAVTIGEWRLAASQLAVQLDGEPLTKALKAMGLAIMGDLATKRGRLIDGMIEAQIAEHVAAKQAEASPDVEA